MPIITHVYIPKLIFKEIVWVERNFFSPLELLFYKTRVFNFLTWKEELSAIGVKFMLVYHQKDSSPKGNAQTFTYLYNLHIVHNTLS